MWWITTTPPNGPWLIGLARYASISSPPSPRMVTVSANVASYIRLPSYPVSGTGDLSGANFAFRAQTRSTMPSLSRCVSSIRKPSSRTWVSGLRRKCSPAARPHTHGRLSPNSRRSQRSISRSYRPACLSQYAASRSTSDGELDEGHEERVDLPDGVHEVLEVDGLADERVGVQRVAAHDVLFGPRRGQHDHRDHQQLVVLLQLGQHLQATAPWQVDVEQDESRARRVGVGAAPMQELQGLLAVGYDVQPVLDLVVLEGLPGHKDVALVVLHQQHVDHFQLVTHQLPRLCAAGRRLLPGAVFQTVPRS